MKGRGRRVCRRGAENAEAEASSRSAFSAPLRDPQHNTSRPGRPTIVLLAALAAAGCPWSNHHPCPDDGIVRDNVRYANDAYYDSDGLIYGVTGDTPLSECTEIRGKVILAGEVTTFSDFDDIVSMEGFADANVDLPSAGDVLDGLHPDHQGCGLIQGFPNLRRMEGIQMEHNSFVDITEGCIFYDGFGALEFAGDDFVCSGTESVGSALVEVQGVLRCPNRRLQNLERVEQLRLDGAPLPNLVWAGALSMPSEAEGTELYLPSLEVLGEGYEGGEGLGELSPGLRAGGSRVTNVALASLQRVDGDLILSGLGSSLAETYEQEDRGDEIRALVEHVDVSGFKRICRNGPNDPCPYDAECEAVHGADSILCCEATWPECLERFTREEM